MLLPLSVSLPPLTLSLLVFGAAYGGINNQQTQRLWRPPDGAPSRHQQHFGPCHPYELHMLADPGVLRTDRA